MTTKQRLVDVRDTLTKRLGVLKAFSWGWLTKTRLEGVAKRGDVEVTIRVDVRLNTHPTGGLRGMEVQVRLSDRLLTWDETKAIASLMTDVDSMMSDILDSFASVAIYE